MLRRGQVSQGGRPRAESPRERRARGEQSAEQVGALPAHRSRWSMTRGRRRLGREPGVWRPSSASPSSGQGVGGLPFGVSVPSWLGLERGSGCSPSLKSSFMEVLVCATGCVQYFIARSHPFRQLVTHGFSQMAQQGLSSPPQFLPGQPCPWSPRSSVARLQCTFTSPPEHRQMALPQAEKEVLISSK